jgi:hypothetical protein
MIAIKDFKMPENCLKCPMQFGGWCYVSPPEVDERVAPTVDEAWEQGKPDWCPLIDVPDYSDKKDDLIDALEKCGIVWSDKFEKVITVKELALFYGEKYETLQRKIERFSNDLVGDVREINKSDELFDRLKRNRVTSNKTPKIMVIYPTGVAKIAYFSEGVKQHEVRQALSKINHRLHEELSVKYSDIYFSKVYQKEMSYLINNIFHSHKVENEKYVEGYRIDFLIDDHIAIECDESVHDYYNRDHEESRKKLMETKGYSFYRYDARKKNMLSFVGDLIDKEMGNPIGKCSEIPNNSDCVSILAAVEAIANQSRFSAEEIINICDKSVQDENGWLGGLKEAILAVLELPSVQSETAKRIVGKSKDGMTLWYQCDMCNEPVDAQDNFCRGCGRRLTDG